MSDQEYAPLTVLIVAEERRFNRSYEFTPDTTLGHIMTTWIEECDLSGFWVFTSPDREHRYFDFMSLEMVGESIPSSGIVNLRVKLLDEPDIFDLDQRPTSEIFGLVNEKCHYIEVEPEQPLYEIQGCLPGRPRELEHNGLPLNLEETVDEAGLKNNDVVQECQRQINVNVKLSNGVTRIFQVAENSFVLHLFETVNEHENGDISLKYEDRYLHMQERVRDLKEVVEVSRAHFDVDINDSQIKWTTRGEPTTFPNFLAQLSFHGEMDIKELEMMEFSCVGCRRCLFKSEDVQCLPIECCRERSLKLTAKPHSITKTDVDTQAALKSIQDLIEQMHWSHDTSLRAGVSRDVYKQVNESLEKSGIVYNTYMKCFEKIKENILKLEDALNAIKKERESLKAKNAEMEDESQTMKALHATVEEKVLTLKAKNTSLEANAESYQKVVRCLHENTGVKLLVFFRPDAFSPVVSRPEIQTQGKYSWTANPHVKCLIPDLKAGWASWEAVRDALQPLFCDGVIQAIGQQRGAAKGRDVAAVTSLADDEVPRTWKHTEFCDEDGRQATWEEAGKPWKLQEIREGGRILICGGQRRTVLSI